MGGRAKSYLSKLCARRGSDGGWCAEEVSAFSGCRLQARINGGLSASPLSCIVLQQPLTLADVSCAGMMKSGPGPGLSPTAGMKE